MKTEPLVKLVWFTVGLWVGATLYNPRIIESRRALVMVGGVALLLGGIWVIKWLVGRFGNKEGQS
jgi:hypothetical protein